MNVFLPFKKSDNRFISEIFSNENFKIRYGSIHEFTDDIDIVNIHWPEAIFGFKEPSIVELNELEEKLVEWRKKAKIVYVRHNVKPHRSSSSIFKQLYNLVEHHADAIVHLGEYSWKNFNVSKKPNHIIRHPLYSVFDTKISKKFSRESLSLNENDIVILVFGSIRNKEEYNLLMKAFRGFSCDYPKAKLIVPRMNFTQFKLRVPLFNKALKALLRAYYFANRKYVFGYNFVSEKRLPIYLQACDLVFIPRIDVLNSGNVFLGLTYGKTVVGPKLGNITETLTELELPVFDPNKIDSVIRALKAGLDISKADHMRGISGLIQKNYNSDSISLQYLKLFRDLLIRQF